MGSLFGFLEEMVVLVGTLCLPVTLGSPTVGVQNMIEFVVLDFPIIDYNIISGRPALNAFQDVVSTYYFKIKLPVGD